MNDQQEQDASLGSESESSVNDFDFSNDGVMPADLDSPGTLSPEAVDTASGVEKFPLKEFSTVIEGLNRLPSWIVFPVDLAKCLEASVRILADKPRAAALDLDFTRRLVREAVPSTFEKCLDDSALYKWSDDIHCNIYDAVLQMMDVLILKLQQLRDEEFDVEAEEDLIQLLKTLSLAFDCTCHFHEHHIRDPLPPEIEVEFNFSEPLLVPVSENEMQEDNLPQEGHFWLAAMLNAMGDKQGYKALEEALESPEHLSINLLRAGLLPISTAVKSLTDPVLEPFVAVCENVLCHISDLLETDVEELSMRGSDNTYSGTSQLLGYIFEILARHDGPEQANKKVGEVQKQFVSKMLSYSNFNKHLSAVREILKLLKRSHSIQEDEGGSSLTANLEWLNSEDVMKAMLRGNLHQKQYVDQVQKILQYLLREGCMKLEHLDILWGVTEKAETFETVKSNIYNLLVELAFDFSAEQLDLLFDKFESARGRPAADTVKVAQLLCKIAEADVDGVMAERLVGLLWNIVASPGAPKEVLHSGILADVASVYEARQGSNILEALCLRCLELINDNSEEPAMRGLFLLRQLVSKAPQQKAAEGDPLQGGAGCARRLLEQHRTSELILSSIESFVEMQRAQRAAKGTPGPPADDPVSNARIQGLRERVQTLLLLGKMAGTCLHWDIIERMWACLVSASVMPEDKQLGYLVFLEMLPVERPSERIVDTETARRIVTEKFPGQPAKDLCEAGFKCFQCYFFAVGMVDRKIVQEEGEGALVTKNLDLSGIAYLWAVATGARRQAVASAACGALVKLHVSLGEGLKEQAASIQRAMIEDVLEKMLKASETLLRAPDDEAEVPHILADEDPMILSPRPTPRGERDVEQASFCALRCMEALLLILERCSPRSMPRMPSHSAACCKAMQRLEVTIPSSAASPSPRFVYRAGTSDYVGKLRRAVANKLKVPSERVRLLTAGHELNNDAKQISQVGIGDGQIVNAAVSEVSNTYSGSDGEIGPDTTPVGILASRTQIFDALLRVADLPGARWETQHAATELLHTLPTLPVVPKSITEALTFEQPREALEQLLAKSGSITSTRLVYFVEALEALLCPPPRYTLLQGSAEAQEGLLKTFVESGCIEALLSAEGVGIQEEVRRLASGDSGGEIGYRRQLVSKGLFASAMLLKFIVCPPKTGQGEDPRGFDLPDSTVELVLHHVLGAIWIAGRTWLPESDNSELAELEQRVVMEALRVLIGAIAKNPQVLQVVVDYPIVKRIITENLLNKRGSFGSIVRTQVATAFTQIFCSPQTTAIMLDGGSGGPSIPASRWYLRALIGAREATNAVPTACWEYFHSLVTCLQNAQEPQEEAAELLESEMLALEKARPPEEEADRRLPGQLHVVRELVRTLERHGHGTRSHGRLVNLILSKLLFPEAAALHRIAAQRTAQGLENELMDPAHVTLSLHSPCDSQSLRVVALEMLVELMTGDSSSLEEGVRLLMDVHYSDEPHFEWEHQPTFNRRTKQRFCGLKNAGATCYMNATIQQLFMTTGLRSLLLGCDDNSEDNKADSVLYQLQVMFAHLAMSTLEFYIPRQFWRAFKDYDGEPINLREHQDAFEFLTRLQDLVDQGLSDSQQLQVMKSTMGGKFAQQVICRGVSYRSETEQDFMGISVDVRGKRNLLDSLSSYVQGELMEGENAYFCEEVGRKVDAVKRACVKTLPDTLVIHLKRFEFDFDTMLRWKIRDRFEFPANLNMYNYTVEGLAEAEGQSIPGAKRPSEYYEYELVGIVVHSGTAFVGHYYSYIKERATQKPDPTSKDGWWVFDDNSVQPWDLGNMDRDCFGGKSSVDVFDNATQQHVPQEFDRPNSAYLLVYERSRASESSSPPQQRPSGAAASAADCPPREPAAPGSTDVAPEAINDIENMAMSSSQAAAEGGDAPPKSPETPPSAVWRGAPKCVDLEVPGIGKLSIQSSVYKNVTLDNLHMIDDMHRLDRDYFHFIRHLVEVQSEQAQAEPAHRKLRRTEPPEASGSASGSVPEGAIGPLPAESNSKSPSPSPSTAISAELSVSRISEPHSERADEMAVMAIRLATGFLLKLYFRAHTSLRDDIPSWKAAMTHLMEVSAPANIAWMQAISGETDSGSGAGDPKPVQAIGRFLLMCPSVQVRQMFGKLVAASVKAALQQGAELDAAPMQQGVTPLTQATRVMVHHVAMFVGEVLRLNSLKIPTNELLTLIHEIALLGPGPTRFLMSLNGLIQQMVELLTNRYTFYTNNPEACDLSPLISCLARFIRFCNALEKPGGNPYLLPQPGDEAAASGSGDEAAAAPSDDPEVGPAPAPAAAAAAAAPLRLNVAPEAAKALLDRTLVCLAENLHLPEVDLTLAAISYEASGYSYEVVLQVLDNIQRADPEDLVSYTDKIGKLIAIPDVFLPARMQLFLNPSETPMNVLTINEQILDDPLPPGKRFALLKVVLAVADASSPDKVRSVLSSDPLAVKEWKEALERLEGDTAEANAAHAAEEDVQRLRKLLAQQ